MQSAKLVYMANQIGKFFQAQGSETAVTGVYEHIRKFWDPRMRRQLRAYLEAGGEGLGDLARAAVERLQIAQG